MENESPPSPGGRWLGPSELACRLGISIKALRVYENAGLVRPGRREGGWRIYGPDDIARLHQVLALKSVGLALAQVRQVLEAPASDLKQTLGIQQRHLAAQIGDLQRRLAAVNLAQRRLDEEGRLGVEQIIALTTETAIAPPVSAEQVEAIIHGLARSPQADSELERFEQRLHRQLEASGISHTEIERSVSEIVADASVAAQRSAPDSKEGREIAKRWQLLVDRLDPATAQVFEAPDGAVARFAAVIGDDPNLKSALNFLRLAVAASSSPRRRSTKS